MQLGKISQVSLLIFQFSVDDSSNGFPNVGVNSLVVMPYDTDIIWAGTEIGLVESLDRVRLLESCKFKFTIC